MSALQHVLVCHSGRQHSHRLALALASEDRLGGYWTGVPCLKEHGQYVPRKIWLKFIRYAEVPLANDIVKFFPISPVCVKVAGLSPWQNLAKRIEYAGYWAFDRWAAWNLKKIDRKFDMVIAYENSSLETFKVAKKMGMTTVLDAASIHHQAQDRVWPYDESPAFHRRITRRKDEEVCLADHIITASEMAKESYVKAGVPEEKVSVIPLGANLALFSPSDGAGNRKEFVFLYVGMISYRKGIDVLIRALEILKRSNMERRICLWLAGPEGDALEMVRSSGVRHRYWGKASQKELAEIYRGADCFVFPTRMDSFGMVVPEALSSGLPVCVSSMAGAKDLVDHGHTGWIFPNEDASALAEHMQWCLSNPDGFNRMREEVLKMDLQQMSWDAYHQRILDWLGAVS